MLKLINFGFAGLIAMGVDFGLFAFLVRSAHWPWFPAGCLSFALGVGVNYAISIRIVFSSGVRFKKADEILLIFLISVIGLALNQALLYLAIHLGLAPLTAKICVSPVIIGWNFLARSQFVFRPKSIAKAAAKPAEL